MTYTPGFYYDALVWAALLYGAGVVFKFGSVFLYESLMPWFSDHPAERHPKPHLEKTRALLWWGLGVYLLLSGLVQIAPQVALGDHQSLMEIMNLGRVSGLGAVFERGWIGAWAIHPITYNILSFMVQAVLGIFLLTERATLLGNITMGITAAWGLLMAIFAEGLGMLFEFHNSIVSGSPGAGIIVAVLAFLLLIPRNRWSTKVWIKRGRLTWGILWALGLLWQCAFFSRPRQAGLFLVSRSFPQPGIVIDVINAIGRWGARDPVLVNLVLIVLIAVVGAMVFFNIAGNGLVATIILFIFWWVNQDFGLLPQFGLMLNTAPLWALVAWAFNDTLKKTAAG